MRNLFVLIFAAMLMQGVAFAASGHKAELTTTVEMGEAMLAMMEALASMGGEGGAPELEDMEPVVVNQTVYWSDAGMRMDTLVESGVSASVIYDYANNTTYSFNSMEPVATKMAIDGMAGEMGMGGPDAMGLFLDWESAIAGMQSQPFMVVNELAERTIAGLPCTGVSFTLDMEAMMAEHAGSSDDGDTAMAMGMMGAMGGMGGEVWVSEGLGFPVLVEISAMGSLVSMALGNVADWTVDEAMFAVPAGYEIEEFEMPDFGDWEMPEGHAIPEGH